MKTTIEYRNVDLEIGYYIQPEERQTLEYPGCDAELVIEELFINEVDVMELLETQIEEIEQELIKYLKP